MEVDTETLLGSSFVGGNMDGGKSRKVLTIVVVYGHRCIHTLHRVSTSQGKTVISNKYAENEHFFRQTTKAWSDAHCYPRPLQ